ncbi:MAG: preprotein translocase subunit SecE [Candidatus Neomarinimicrobiota bacterium]|nr:preprotein translocase subunit SecE [Candidatus Neomarinimicrobiota bacterium]RKY49979.1 MAG: preprotein translocase subunit SecE [Candidatus Neomarinimicrobiota bacterium]
MIKKIRDFLASVQFEMKKVTWPTFEELKGSTKVVIVFSIILVVFLFVVDFILSQSVNALMY